MTAKEKAEDLIKKFTLNTRCFSETKGWKDSLYDAKQCALIAVDEILNILWHTHTHKNESEYRYYQEVKQEIEKLLK